MRPPRPRFDRDIRPSEITPESTWLNRRAFMGRSLAGATALVGVAGCEGEVTASALPRAEAAPSLRGPVRPWLDERAAAAATSTFSTDETPTPALDAMRYNNFYEFGTGKDDPVTHAHELTTTPWTVKVTGAAAQTGTYDFDDLFRPAALEERIYRLRCVEAWSMVIPWVGVPLADLIKRFEPEGKAKYVAFETLEDRDQFRGQRSYFSSIDWPYREGLRLDEAMNPLTLIAVGIYGRELPNQNGAPLRLVVPWKYGFKSIKSIVRVHFSERMPKTTWNMLQPSEYGFYANVNPDVSHPRWSQANERRLPSTLFAPNRIETRKFNGYGEHVAHLYAGMDLRRNY